MTTVTSSARSAEAPVEPRIASRVAGISLADIAATAFFAAVAFPRAAIPLIDGDVWWHIRAGGVVLDTGRIPREDSWTIVSVGERWISQDWLSNVILAGGYRLAEWGPTVLSVLFSLFVVAALWLLWRAVGIRSPGTGWLSRIVWLAAGLTVAGPVIGVRVQVVDLLLSVASVAVLWVYLRNRQWLTLAWLPAISLVWANMHAGWLLMFLLGGAYMVGEAADRLLGRPIEPEPLTWPDIARVGAALALALLAVAANPSGTELYRYPFETSAIAAHRDFLAEWSPPNYATLPGQLFAGFLVIGVLPAFAFGWRLMRTGDALMLGGLVVMALTAARFLGIAGPVGAAVVAMSLAPIVSRSPFGRRFGPLLARMAKEPKSRRLAVVNLALATALVMAGLFVALARVSPVAQARAVSEHMPVAAVDWIEANDPGNRPFNTYSWGGYLGWARPDVLVFIDGRSDVHGDAPIRAYADAISLRSDPAVLLDEYAIDHVLFNTDHPFAAWLNQSEQWERAYTDALASVWVRRGAASD